jgi:GntR family transcriptional regulator
MRTTPTFSDIIDTRSPRPLYEQIKEYLLGQIQAGTYRPGDRIPSERELAQKLGVSRLTVHQAVKDLQQGGVLVAYVGKGTFVSPQTLQQQLEALTSFTEEMRSRGHSPSSRVLSTHQEAAPDDIARMLQLRPGTQLHVLRRLRLADGQPMALETSYIVAALCPGLLEKFDFAIESLYRVMRQEYGLQLGTAEQTIESRGALREEAEALDIRLHTPLLFMTRVLYAEDGTPLEYVRSAYRGDRYKFHVVLKQV